MNNFRLLTDTILLNRQEWADFISRHPDGSVFQSPDLYDHLVNSPNYKPVFVACLDVENHLRGILLGFIIRERKGFWGTFYSRVIVHAGPLIDIHLPDRKVICDQLLRGFIQKVRKKSLLIQVRNHFDLSEFLDIFKKHGFLFQEHLNLIVHPLRSDSPQQKVKKRKLQQVRKSLGAGAVITEASSDKEIEELYSILQNLYKHKVKKPLPSRAFFIEFLRSSKQQKLGVILLVKYQGRIVAGMVCPITPGKAMYEWYVCGLDREYTSIHPSVLITWAGIEYARTKNIPIFDFMGIGKPGKEYGVRNFKMGFGGTIVKHGRFLRINNQGLYRIAKLGLKILASLNRV